MSEADSAVASAKGFALELVNSATDLIEQLRATHHLGALAEDAGPVRTRLEYVAAICDELLRLKEGRPGLGLGSTYKEKIGGRSFTGLSLAQTWAILLNAGHLFGTFATERGLLFAMHREPEIGARLLNEIPEFAHPWCSQILEERNPHRFFSVLAAFRLVRSSCFGSVGNAALHALIKYPLGGAGDGTFERAKWAFKRARQIAYNRVQSQLGLGAYLQEGQLELLASHVRRSSSGLGFDPSSDRQNRAIRVLDALDEYHAEELFADKGSARRVLAHLKEFKDWWLANRDDADLPGTLFKLFSRPANWPSEPTPELNHYVRLHLASTGMDWLAEVVRWLDNDRCWMKSNFYINPSHDLHTNGFSCDLYCNGPFPPTAATHVAGLLAEQAAVAPHSEKHLATRVWRSLGRFLGALLRDIVHDGSVLIEPTARRNGTMGYAVAGLNRDAALGRLDNVIQDVASEERRRELKGMSQAARSIPSENVDAPHMVSLGPIKLIRRDGTTAAEIDGLWCGFQGPSLEWTLLEHKSGRQTGAASQLDATLALLSTGKCTRGELDLVNGRGAWARFVSPQMDVPGQLRLEL